MTASQQAADLGVRELSEGAFRLEFVGSAVYLVKDRTGERVLIPRSIDERQDPSDEVSRLPVERLSERELQVFDHLSYGIGMQAIADRMGVSIKTVETYRARIKQKLEVGDRMQLIALAVAWRLRNPIVKAPPEAKSALPPTGTCG
jgi:DNA-binding NarL/FixJ family response regulator